MFRSSQNLRLAAEMRALHRLAAPWRAARTTWFDGTPESIEARIAATDRVLTVARSGFTPAHLALTTEAAAARAELTAAKHRLLTDFLDDGARAFKGSRRTAGDGPGPGSIDDFMFPNHRKPTGADYLAEMEPEDRPGYGEVGHQVCKHCEEPISMLGSGYGHYSGHNRIGEPDFYDHDHEAEPWDYDDDDDDDDYRTGARTATSPLGPGYDKFGPDDIAEYEDYLHQHDYHTEPEDLHGLSHRLHVHDLDEDDPARYSALADDSIPYTNSMRFPGDKERNRYTIQDIPGPRVTGQPGRAIVNHDDTEMISADGAHHWANRHTADLPSVGEGGAGIADMVDTSMRDTQSGRAYMGLPGAAMAAGNALGVSPMLSGAGDDVTPLTTGPRAAHRTADAADELLF